MSIFDLILNSFSPSTKIYSSKIKNLPGSRFNRQVIVQMGGKKLPLQGEKLRDYLAGLAQGGITYTSLEEKLKRAGLKDKQYNKRVEIMKVLKSTQELKTGKTKAEEAKKSKLKNDKDKLSNFDLDNIDFDNI